MRLLLACVTILAGCAASAPESSQRAPAVEQGPPRLPFNPFASARVGDWQTLSIRVGHTGDPRPDMRLALRTYRVVAIDADAVTVEAETLLPDGSRADPSRTRFERSRPPTVESFALERGPMEGYQTRSDWHDRLGRRFDCTLFRYRTRSGDRVAKTALKVHPEVKGMGLVFLTVEVDRPGQPRSWIDWELVGYGTAGRTAWGRSETEAVLPSLDASIPRSTWRDPARGLALELPRFASVGPDEVALPLQAWVALGRAGPGEIAVKVLRAGSRPPTQEAVRAQVEAQCAQAGMSLRDERELRIGAAPGAVYECAGSGKRLLYLSLPGAPFSYFVTASAPDAVFDDYRRAFQRCLESLRVGPRVEETEDDGPVYRDELYGFSLRLPPIGLGGPGVALRFSSAPVLGAITEMVEVIEVPGDLGLDEVVGNFTDGATLNRWEERVVCGREGRLLEVAAAAGGAEGLYRVLAVQLDDRALVVSCGARKERFERWASELRACLDSLAIR